MTLYFCNKCGYRLLKSTKLWVRMAEMIFLTRSGSGPPEDYGSTYQRFIPRKKKGLGKCAQIGYNWFWKKVHCPVGRRKRMGYNMALLEEWKKIAYNEKADKEELQRFWQRYFLLEKGIYEKLLENPEEEVRGTVKELAEK